MSKVVVKILKYEAVNNFFLINISIIDIKKRKPTYVAVWKVTDKPQKIIEVTYVGTHEKAEYNRLC